MTSNMDPRTGKSNDSQRQGSGNRDTLLGCVALGVLLAAMALWLFYPHLSGKHTAFADFLLFWGREAILVFFFLGALVFIGVAAFWRVVARAFSPRRQP